MVILVLILMLILALMVLCSETWGKVGKTEVNKQSCILLDMVGAMVSCGG